MKIVFTGAAGFIAGYAIEELLNNGHEVVGIDNFSKYGKLEKSYSKNPKYTFIEGDAQKLPFADASFDRVLMNFGLLHLSRPEKACSEAFRVLRAGGKFGFTIWAEPHENPGGKIVNDAI